MLELQRAIKKVIERFIVNTTPMTETVAAGSTVIPLASSRRYRRCDPVAIYNQTTLDTTGEGEIKTIECIPDANSIQVDTALVDSYTPNDSFVQKMVGGRFVEGIYLGDPAKISHFPAITINATEKTNEWFTLESTTSTFSIDITIFTLASDYEQSYTLMHNYADQIERSLFRSLMPLVQPYQLATLADDVAADQNIIRITDSNDITRHRWGFVFLEDYDNLRSNRIADVLDAGVFELRFNAGSDFAAGSNVIVPGRHFYNAFPRGIRFGTINQETAVLKAAVISYMAQEEVKRFTPFIDPLTY